MECGTSCTTPKSTSALAIVKREPSCFEIRPLDLSSRCRIESVATYALYENARPDVLYEPGRALSLADAIYEQVDGPDGPCLSSQVHSFGYVHGKASGWVSRHRHQIDQTTHKLSFHAVCFCKCQRSRNQISNRRDYGMRCIMCYFVIDLGLPIFMKAPSCLEIRIVDSSTRCEVNSVAPHALYALI